MQHASEAKRKDLMGRICCTALHCTARMQVGKWCMLWHAMSCHVMSCQLGAGRSEAFFSQVCCDTVLLCWCTALPTLDVPCTLQCTAAWPCVTAMNVHLRNTPTFSTETTRPPLLNLRTSPSLPTPAPTQSQHPDSSDAARCPPPSTPPLRTTRDAPSPCGVAPPTTPSVPSPARSGSNAPRSRGLRSR